jgi:hypothetical protein
LGHPRAQCLGQPAGDSCPGRNDYSDYNDYNDYSGHS